MRSNMTATIEDSEDRRVHFDVNKAYGRIDVYCRNDESEFTLWMSPDEIDDLIQFLSWAKVVLDK